jgi:hypothetical protein
MTEEKVTIKVKEGFTPASAPITHEEKGFTPQPPPKPIEPKKK